MSELYREAVIEADNLRKFATANATKVIIEAIMPRLKTMIDREILNETPLNLDEDIVGSALSGVDGDPGLGIPDESGKMTLDLDSIIDTDKEIPVSGLASVGTTGAAIPATSAMVGSAPVESAGPSDEDLLLNFESVRALISLKEAVTPKTINEVKTRIQRLKDGLGFATDLIESDKGRDKKSLKFLGRLIGKMLVESQILQIETIGSGKRGRDASTAEIVSDLKALREEIEQMDTRRKITEMDVMLKLTLPEDADVDLGDLDVEIVPDDSEDVGELSDMPVDAGEDSGEEIESDDVAEGEEMYEKDEKDEAELSEGDLQLKISGLPDDAELDPETIDVSVVGEDGEEIGGGDDFGAELPVGDDMGDEAGDAAPEMDFDSLSDDDVVEIDEAMLRKELARMRKIAEGNAADPKIVDDFGGGKIEREAFVDSTDKDLNKQDKVGTVKVEAKTFERLKNESRQNRALRTEVDKLTRKLAEATKRQGELNLFNAKLLYVNKLLQAGGVVDRKMKTVVESFDKARTLREVRLLYKTFSDSLGKGKGGASGESLTEATRRTAAGGSSRPSGRAPTSAASVSDPSLDRWARLAGISADK